LPVANINPIVPNVITLVSGDVLPIVTFSGNVLGGTYSWAKTSSTAITNMPANGTGNFPGASDIQLYNETAAMQTATFRVTASNGNATCGTDTEDFTVNLYPVPTISGTLRDITVCSGTTEAISLTSQLNVVEYRIAYVSGSTLVATPTVLNGGDITGTYTNSTSNPITAVFSVTPFNTVVGRAGVAQLFSVTVLPELKASEICVNNYVYNNGDVVPQITFGTTISGAHFLWTKDGINIGSSATSGIDFVPSFNAVNITGAAIQATYTVWIKYTDGQGHECTSAEKQFTITVMPRLAYDPSLYAYLTPNTPTPNNANQVVCAEDAFANVYLSAALLIGGDVTSTSTFMYRLVEGVDVIGPYQSSTTVGYLFTGAEAQPWQLSAQAGRTVGTGKYEVTPIYQDKMGQTVLLTFTRLPKPTVEALSNVVLCSGDALNVTFQSADGSAKSFEWEVKSGSIAGIPTSGRTTSGISATSLVNTGSTPSVITISVTGVNGVCLGDAQTFTVTVNPTPRVDAVANLFIQSGAAVAVNFTGVATSYVWTADANAAIIGSASSGTGNISFTSSAVNEPTAVTYTVTPYYDNCVGTPITFSVVVANKPVIADLNDVIATDGDHINSVVPDGLPNGSGYGIDWTGGSTIGLNDGSGKNIPAFTAHFTGSDPFAEQVVTITVTPYVIVNGTKYFGEPTTYTYTVYPKTVVDNRYAANHANIKDEICVADGSSSVTFIAEITSGVNVTYQWYKNGAAIVGAYGIVGANHKVELTISNATNDDAGLYYVVFGTDVKSVVYELTVKTSIIYQQWNDVLVIADASTNGGYAFKNIVWYKDGVAQPQNGLFYNESPLSTTSHYHFSAIDQNGNPYVSCDFIPVNLTQAVIAVFPNPAKVGENVTVTNAPTTSTVQITSQQGVVLSTNAGEGAETIVKVPYTPGVYIINVIENDVKKSVSIIVR
jgi:hypothetical protein